jgi:hypothetical protein
MHDAICNPKENLMNRTHTLTHTAVPVQVTVFAVAAVLLFWAAFFYPMNASAAESQTLAASQTLSAGGSDWIPFDYSGGNEPIELWIDSANDGVTFAVWTPERLAADEDEREPIGRGSEDDNTPGDSYWTGEFADAGTYYIEVQNPSGAADTFSLYVQSDAVSVEPLLDSVAVVSEATTLNPNGGEGISTESATVTESALPAVDQWQAIAPGETVWFTVGYAGDSETIEVWAEADSSDVSFAVYTNDQYMNDEDPVGRGSDGDFTHGDLFWTGNFTLPDTLHIAVTNNGTITNNYNLHISQ